MHYRLPVLLAAEIAFVLSSPPTCAEQPTAEVEGQNAFKSWGDLVVGGTWCATYEGVQQEDTYEWLLDRKFIRLTWRTGGSTAADGTSVLGIDPRTGKMTWWEFFEDGTVGQGTHTLVKDGQWSITIHYDGPKGKQSWTATVSKQAADQVKVESERVTNGKSEGKQTSLWTRKGN